jgi:adenylate cyclase
MNQHSDTSSGNARIHALIITGLALGMIFLEIYGAFPFVTTPTERVELSISDTAFRLRGVRPPNPDFVIAAIDDDSLVWRNERWPWSRAYIAEIVDWLNAAGASVIALDFTLFDPSTLPEDDVILAQSLDEAQAAVTVNQIINNQFTVTFAAPLPIFQDVLDGFGITEIERDDDAIVRSINAYKSYSDQIYYNWAFEVAQAYLQTSDPANPSLAKLDFAGQAVPLNNQGRMLVNFAGPAQTYPHYSAAFIPLGDYPPEAFAGKVVFIGATSETLQDLYPTPFSTTDLTPGVEVVANAVDTLVSGRFLRLVPPWVTLLIIIGMAILSWFIIKIPQPTVSILSVFIGMVLLFIIRQVVFTTAGWELSIINPGIMLFLGVVAPTLEQAVTQEIEKRRVRTLFSRFISPQMVEQILNSKDIDKLNKRTELTILFSDIRSFTTISEKLLPEQVVALLNPYLEVMTEIIHKHGGTVDKYEGDAIVAFFGEPIAYPDHAMRAARASLEMREALKELTDGWLREGSFTERFEMGIGLNTGEVFVGLLGSEERVNYTIIGDAANLAARLQDQTKEYNWPILISGDTYAQIKTGFEAEFLESKLLKGKTEPVEIYKLTGEFGGLSVTQDEAYASDLSAVV